MSDVLRVTNISKTFIEGQRRLTVWENIAFTLAHQERMAIVGQSGCGKTTLLNCLGLLDTPTSGEIALLGAPTSQLSDKAATQRRNQALGFVFQHHHLLFEFTALENVMMPLWLRDNKRLSDSVGRALLTRLGLKERLTHKPSALSGGERQRVAIARALIHQPKLLLADEPTGNLDPQTAAQVMRILQEAVQAQDTALILVTHDAAIAQQMDKQFTLLSSADV